LSIKLCDDTYDVSYFLFMKNEFKRILIIRPSAMGDIVMATSMIGILREAFPEAFIAWLVDSSYQDLLSKNPQLDKIIKWPKARWKCLIKKGKYLDFLKELKAFLKELRTLNFDLAIDAQGLLRSRAFAWFSGAEVRLGLDSKEPGRFLMTRIISQKRDDKRMGSEYMELMDALGLSFDKLRVTMEIFPGEEDDVSAKKILMDSSVASPYAVFCPFTTRPQKHWLIERWCKLSEELEKLLNLKTVVLGGSGDKHEGARLSQVSMGRIIDLTGKTTLLQSAAIIRNSSLVIGVDTGLTHMGIAYNRPTVAIFGSTCPYLHTSQKNAAVIYNRFPCSPCRRQPVCGDSFACMVSITTEQVINIVKGLLNQDAYFTH
jgi:heptosyltransferase-1